MNRKQLIKKYIEFFKSKNHKEIPNSSLIPANDPTVLFNTAGMQPIVPYLLGQKHPSGKRLVNVQKCIRTVDIDSVGDSYHQTFFEMLGNWSLGDYWKEEAIKMTLEFHTKILKIPLEYYAVTCFGGDPEFPDLPKDTESAKIWEHLGISKERIAFISGGVKDSEDNWWGPAGKTGPCGPSTEQFFWTGPEKPPKKFDPRNEKWVEIGNDVLLEYNKTNSEKYEKAKQKNIDFGGGVERALALLNNTEDNYQTPVFLPIIKKIESLSKKNYKEKKKEMRIIADHIKASVFIIADGALPSNSEQGYVLRRLIRRAIRYGRKLDLENFVKEVAKPVFEIYDDYEHLKEKKKEILQELEKEENKFLTTLEKGMRMFEKISTKNISGKDAFLLYQSYGFPIEMVLELAKEKAIKVDEAGFEKENKKHQDLSRTASKGKFSSGLADHSDKTIKLHTATHLLNEALRKTLGDKVKQRGSNINPERLRFDFSFDRKLSPQELEKVEKLVNEKIKKGLKVIKEEMPLKKALQIGAQAEFGHKYPDKVTVYTLLEDDNWFSKEICTGPHVSNTKELGKFKIIKEESSSAGVRRIKATVD